MKNPAFLILLPMVVLLLLLGCSSTPDDSCTADAYEPNESIDTCYFLGTIEEDTPEVSYTAQISAQGDIDFYRIYAEEGSAFCIPATDQNFRVQIRLVPPAGKNYDLYVYDDSYNALGSSVATGDAEESFTCEWGGLCGEDDSEYIRIEVRSSGSAWACEEYTLYIDMWEI